MLNRDILREVHSLKKAIECLEEADRSLVLGGLVGSAPGLLIAETSLKTERPILWIVKDQNTCYDACDDLRFFGSILGGNIRALPFPHLETLPYEEITPQTEIRSLRLHVWKMLARVDGNDPGPFVIVAPIRSILKNLPPLEFIREQTLFLERGMERDREALTRYLLENGFEYRELITAPGEFSPRGGILDVFPLTEDKPYRIEFFGDEIESIRAFDPVSQRSVDQVAQLAILPGEEHRLTRQAVFSGPGLTGLLDMLPDNTTTFLEGPDTLEAEASRVEELVRKMYREVRDKGSVTGNATLLEEEDNTVPQAPPPDTGSLIPPGVLYSGYETVLARFQALGAHRLHEFIQPGDSLIVRTGPEDFGVLETQQRLDRIGERLNEGERFLIVCDNEGQRQRLNELLEEALLEHPDQMEIVVGEMGIGFSLPEVRLALVTDRELFHRYRRVRVDERHVITIPLQDVVDLTPGDYVVHVDHGIGQFVGLQQLETDDGLLDFFELLYAEGDVLYVPIDQINRIGRYIGTDAAPPALSRLGGKAWAGVKERAKAAIEEMAQELIDLYAERAIRGGYSFGEDTRWQREFEAAFPYQETPDQLRSIAEIKEDMESDKPMDRLLCGDVGFGKTEVALRAAFKAAMVGKQVALLCPTTILAQQHYTTFRSRMADFPVRIEMLSRLKDQSAQKTILQDLALGKVDIIIGTHRLLQKDVEFFNLGLFILDEEQRFGVRQKERLKQLRRTVDCLTMTATPIPRTLCMSLNGVRDMSLVNTAPANRHPILTYVSNFDKTVIESAILRELSRGGQVYFLHNRVASIDAMAEYIQKIAPEARIVTGHGQMERHKLEEVMNRFIDREFDILVSTTIIESGIDIPNVNTILINRADCFGLAELYQLRGRVGRESHQAYCYLLIPASQALTDRARRRLLAIQEFNQLGSGFQLALRDMEIRGMGNILGKQQHGHIAAIGFQLYNDLLTDAVRRLKGEKSEDRVHTTVEMIRRGGIDPDYVASVKTRMGIQKRLANARNLEEVETIEREMADMFGPVPDRAKRFLDSVRIRVLASNAGFERVEIREEETRLIYSPRIVRQGFPAEKIVALNQRWGLTFQVRPMEETVALTVCDILGTDDSVSRLAKFLRALAQAVCDNENPSTSSGETSGRKEPARAG